MSHHGVKLADALTSASEFQFVEPMSAMAVAKPARGHPNKMPFSGILTRLDTPSDKPPNGSGSRRVVMSAAAAERAIDTLHGMAVSYADSQDRHEPTRKIGVINAASVRDGVVRIDDGHIFAADFPEVARRIQASKDDLGFSWEIADVYVEDPKADPLLITDFAFTGAAILRRDKAAYSGTSLTAAAEEDIAMTKEEMAAAVAEAVGAAIKPVSDRLGQIETTMQASAATRDKVEPHASRLDQAADKMDADGVGADERTGHVKMLRTMASDMRAQAARGAIPSSFSGGMYASAERPSQAAAPKIEDDPAFKALKDELGSTQTKLKDMQAAADRTAAPPERKTERSPEISKFLSKHQADGDGKMSASALDIALKGEDIPTRLRIKAGMKQAGLVSA